MAVSIGGFIDDVVASCITAAISAIVEGNLPAADSRATEDRANEGNGCELHDEFLVVVVD